jgi:uncharacterized protein (DUF1800 family)
MSRKKPKSKKARKAATQPSSERFRVAMAKAKDIVRRQSDLDTCLDDDMKTILTIALAKDYAALFTEYPDVFPAPPISAQKMFAEAGELALAQAAVERERDEAEEAAKQEVDSAIRELTRPPAKPVAPS